MSKDAHTKSLKKETAVLEKGELYNFTYRTTLVIETEFTGSCPDPASRTTIKTAKVSSQWEFLLWGYSLTSALRRPCIGLT